jgi:hypothetical protein
MSSILTSLFTWLQSFIGTINPIPFFLVNADEEAIVLRLGKYHRTYTAGLRWKWPFIEKERKVKISKHMFYAGHEFITEDSVCMSITLIISFSVGDARKVLLEYQDYKEIVDELIKSELNVYIEGLKWQDFKGDKIRKNLEKLKIYINEKKKTGLYVDSICLGEYRLQSAEIWLKELRNNPLLKELMDRLIANKGKNK